MKRKAKKKAAPKPSTALAVRKSAKAPQVIISDPQGLIRSNQAPVGQLGELATVGALGLAELKLTDAEEAVLSEPVNPADVLLKPKVKGGPPEIAYLPHIVYTRWFHRAFGRTGWACVPTAAPKKVNNLVLVTYLLYVHGVPVAAATGEQEYHENNAQQTYGDVIESTVASALRRFAKRLGVGLELWDKRWLEANFGKRAVRGNRREEFIEAEPTAPQSWPPETVAERTAAGRPVLETSPVLTKVQWERLGRIAKTMQRPEAEVNLWLKKRYQVTDLKKIEQRHYGEIIGALEARGALSLPGDGE